MREYELSMHEDLQRVVGYIKDELRDAIIRDTMIEIISDPVYLSMEEDVRYYKKLKLAARRILRHYMVAEDYDKIIAKIDNED